MVRLGRWAVIAAIVVAVTSCVDANQHMTVHPDGSTDVATTLLIDNSVLTMNGGPLMRLLRA